MNGSLNGAGVYGYASTNAVGVKAYSRDSHGVSSLTEGAGSAAIYGYTREDTSVGGRFENLGSGYALTLNSGGVGLYSVSSSNDGVEAMTNGANKSAFYGHTTALGAFGLAAVSTQGIAVYARTSKNTETAGLFENTTGGDAVRAVGRTTLHGPAIIHGAATVHGTATVRVLTINGGVDLAEPFAIRDDAEFPKGSVMVISDERPGELQLSREEYDTRVAGIISGANGINPGLQLTQQGVNDVGGQPVALTGRVYCQADASFGAIKPGDLLTTSSTPGHARKVSEHTRAQGAILGKAMSALPEGTGYVLVLVTLQ